MTPLQVEDTLKRTYPNALEFSSNKNWYTWCSKTYLSHGDIFSFEMHIGTHFDQQTNTLTAAKACYEVEIELPLIGSRQIDFPQLWFVGSSSSVLRDLQRETP